MKNTEYGEYVNRETWVIGLWIENDAEEKAHWLNEAEDCLNSATTTILSDGGMISLDENAMRELTERMKENLCETNFPLQKWDGGIPYDELLSHALENVNWRQLAEKIMKTYRKGNE